jgi:methyl-accepting chemotaxis protein
MVRLFELCLSWFGNLPLKAKLYISFGWMCLFTAILAAVCVGGLVRIKQIADQQAISVATTTHAADAVNKSRTATLADAAEKTTSGFLRLVLGLTGLILLVDCAMAWRLAHIISHPILNACKVLEALSHRDLTVQATIESTDEVGQMGLALNRTIASLHGVLADLTEASAALESLAAELSEAAVNNSTKCQEQRDLAQKVLMATRQASANETKIVSNSEETSKASRESSETAARGREAMSRANETMSQIASSSTTIGDLMIRLDSRAQEIGKVITSIREISENTNLLALNAAIEAARAGEQGRGFAVVTGEVRRLAEHTRTATEEIAGMVTSIQQETASTTCAIKASQASIEDGRLRTEEADQLLELVIERADQTASLAVETTRSATEHSTTSGEIAADAAEVAELAVGSLICSAGVASSMKDVRLAAKRLSDVVCQFRL